MVAWSALVGSGRLWSGVGTGDAVPVKIAVDLAPLEGLVVASPHLSVWFFFSICRKLISPPDQAVS